MTEFTNPAPEVPRDRWGRPLVVPSTGGKPVAYTRCTTFVGVVEDTYNLSKWQQRMVALGLSDRPDLLLAVASNRDDKKHLDTVCEQAMDAAKAGAAATTGTALHLLTERMDRGLGTGVVPEAYVADLEAYARTTAPLKAVHIEAFCVQDMMKVGGTPDRVVTFQGKRYIADLKTGSINFGYLKIAAQLAMYARSRLYDPASHERSPHGAEIDRGIVIHLPAGSGTCTLHWVDLTEGWEAVKVARMVRNLRAHGFKALFSPFAEQPGPTVPLAVPQVEQQHPLQVSMTDAITSAIANAPTEQAVRNLWEQHVDTWTDTHTELAKARITALASTTTN